MRGHGIMTNEEIKKYIINHYTRKYDDTEKMNV